MAKLKNYKYSNEYSIGMFLNRYHILQQFEIEEFAKSQKVFNKNEPCNIYFILRRPKISIDNCYLEIDSNTIKLRYFIHEKETKHIRFIKIEMPGGDNVYRLTSEYPYDEFIITNGHGGGLVSRIATLVDEFHKSGYIIEPLLDFEVLYIGQAHGTNGNKNAMDRITSHATLQKIYSEELRRNPNSEIWIMLCNFRAQHLGTMNGKVESRVEPKKDLKRFKQFMNPDKSHFSDKQKLNFTEAGLIHLFKPQYNKEFKSSFPNQNHTSYSECYNLELNGLIVETDLSMARRNLFSENLSRENSKMTLPYYQCGEFSFLNDDDRYSMFNNDFI